MVKCWSEYYFFNEYQKWRDTHCEDSWHSPSTRNHRWRNRIFHSQSNTESFVRFCKNSNGLTFDDDTYYLTTKSQNAQICTESLAMFNDILIYLTTSPLQNCWSIGSLIFWLWHLTRHFIKESLMRFYNCCEISHKTCEVHFEVFLTSLSGSHSAGVRSERRWEGPQLPFSNQRTPSEKKLKVVSRIYLHQTNTSRGTDRKYFF